MSTVDEPYELTKNDLDALSCVKSDLLRIVCDGKRWDDVSCIQFLNAIKTAFQLPTALVIYKKKGKKYDRQCTTWSDPLRKDSLTKDYLPDYFAVCEKSLIQIYDTDYYLLVLEVERHDKPKKRTEECPLEFRPYPRYLGCINIVEKLLSTNEVTKDKYFVAVKYIEFWNKNLDFYLFKDQHVSFKNRPYPEWSIDNQDIQKRFLNLIRSKIIEPAYSRIYKSWVLDQGDTCRPPNVFYFLRSYDTIDMTSKQDIRYEEYRYRVRMIIPTEQKDSFKKVFKKFRDEVFFEGNFKEKWKFDALDKPLDHFNNSKSDEYVTLFKHELNQRVVAGDDESYDGIDQILKILESPYSEHTRSMVDPALSSAFVDIRRAPLASKLGFDRIHAKHERKASMKDEKIRIAALFYLFSVVNPYKGGRIASMIRPLNVGYSPWLAYVTFSEFKHKDDDVADEVVEDKDRVIEDYINWRKFHNFSYFICGEKQSIRVRAAIDQQYLHLIELLTAETIVNRFRIHRASGYRGALPPNALVDGLQDIFFEFCRFFPYECIEFSLDQPNNEGKGKSEDACFSVRLGKVEPAKFIYGRFVKNQFFPSFDRERVSGRREHIRIAIKNGFQEADERLRSGVLQ